MARFTEEIYVTDYGHVRLRDGQLIDAAEQQTAELWQLHADDLIGVPEIEPDNSAVMTEMQTLAREQWERGIHGPYRYLRHR